MTFVNIGLLAGGALVALPIILHLVMRQQPRELEFPPLRFLQTRRESNRRRLRLRHLLLLLLRAGAIALLAFALARPTIQGTGFLGGEEAPVAAVMVVDTAPRMDYRWQNKTRLAAAQEIATWLITQLPGNSEVAVIDGRAEAPAFAVDLGAANQRLVRLRVTPTARPLTELLEAAATLLETSEKQRREVYVFTDLSAAAWSTGRSETLTERLAKLADVGLYVIDVGADDPQDFALGELRLSRQTLAQNSAVDISVDLARLGPDETRSVELYVLDENGAAKKRGQQSATWSAGEAEQMEFHLGSLPPGTHQGMVRIVGDDSLKWDDVRYFTVNVRRAWNVLLVANPVENALFLSEAIAPSAFRENGQSRFNCTVRTPEQLAEERLADYAAVCVLDPTPLATETWNALGEYAAAGGAVAIFLGRNAQPVDSFNEEAAQKLLAGPLKRQWRDETYLAPQSLSHPMLAQFRPVESSTPWNAFPVYKYWQLDPLSAGANEIMPFASDRPAILEKPVGKGRAITMTTPISDPANRAGREPWNYLPTGLEPWPFVMLANEMLLYMVGSQEERLNYLAGDTAMLRIDGEAPPSVVVLSTPGGDQIRQTVDARNSSTIVITSTDEPGNYRVRAGGEGSGLDRGFSVNIDPRATQLTRLPQEELTKLLGEGKFRLARNREQIDRALNIGRVGQELFPYLIGLVAVVLALEHALANRFYRRPA